jgi:hypothetical protein
MVPVPYLPLFVTILFRGMPGIWQSRHRRIRCWLVCMQALSPGRKTLEELAHWTPAQVTAWRFRRVLKAAYGDIHRLVEWWVQEALNTLPPPKDGTMYLVGDGREKPQRGTQHPLAQQGRTSEHHPWVFGIRFALLSVNGDGSRCPGALRLIRPKTHPAYRTEQALFREMVSRLVPPAWATRVMVTGDAASGSQEHMQRVLKRDADDPARRWGFVCAIARTWKTVEEKAIKDVVTHVPRIYSQRIRVPRLPGSQGCPTFWVSSTRLCLRHVGDVTVVLRTQGRNVGPKQTQILGTTRDEWIPRQVGSAYQRRWPVEQSNRERKTDRGLGAHQVRGEEGRIEKSFGIAVLAYVLLIRACHQEILPGQSWSIAQLQHAWRLRIIMHQVEHHVKTRLTKVRKVASYLA